MWPHPLGAEPHAASPEALSVAQYGGDVGKEGCARWASPAHTREPQAPGNERLHLILKVLNQRPDHLTVKPGAETRARGRTQALHPSSPQAQTSWTAGCFSVRYFISMEGNRRQSSWLSQPERSPEQGPGPHLGCRQPQDGQEAEHPGQEAWGRGAERGGSGQSGPACFWLGTNPGE